jgi:hypothetical protein
MSNTLPYTPEELQGKYIVCFVCIHCVPALDCVRKVGGPHDGHPYLYDSIEAAKDDKYFIFGYDEAVPAEEYFKRVEQELNKVSKL